MPRYAVTRDVALTIYVETEDEDEVTEVSDPQFYEAWGLINAALKPTSVSVGDFYDDDDDVQEVDPDGVPIAVLVTRRDDDAAECRRRGWWAVRAEEGWRPVPPGTPGAIEDLNRLLYFRAMGVDSLYDPRRDDRALRGAEGARS